MESKQQVAFAFTSVDLLVRGDIRLGLQEGRTVVQDVSADTDQAVFTFTLTVQPNAHTGAPRFTGPCAQGTPDQRFVYLCWGTRNPEGWTTRGRSKIPLAPVSWAAIQAARDTNQPIRARILMRDAKGRPVTALLKADQVLWEFGG